MNRYQVVLPSGDMLAITADKAFVNDSQVLTFVNVKHSIPDEISAEVVAQFCNWIGWNLLGPVDDNKVPPDRTPVCDLPTGRE